jgi:NAD(P)H-flavin reductase
MSPENLYKPHLATILEIRQEATGARGIKTFKVRINDDDVRKNFKHIPGQCAMLSVFGVGESIFGIASPPTWKDILEFTVMRVGNVTAALHMMNPGDVIGIRGPYGNGFPIEEFKGKNCIFIGAGVGIAPLRSVYQYVLGPEHRKEFGDVMLIYGARTPADLAYKNEFEEINKRDDVDLQMCIDWKFGSEGMIDEAAEEGWPKINMSCPTDTVIPEGCNHWTCFVPQLVEVAAPSPENAVALTCGPPIAIKFVVQNLEKLGFTDDQVYTTLENRMKCGVGKCGRCNIGEVYVCKDGPVFTRAEIKKMFQEF